MVLPAEPEMVDQLLPPFVLYSQRRIVPTTEPDNVMFSAEPIQIPAVPEIVPPTEFALADTAKVLIGLEQVGFDAYCLRTVTLPELAVVGAETVIICVNCPLVIVHPDGTVQ